MEIEVRKATKEDLKPLAEIYVRAFNPLNIGERWTKESAYKLLLHLFNNQPDLFFVAAEGNKIIGAIVAIVKPWWDGNHITEGEIFVDPDYQGKKIGKKLIRKLFAVAKKKYKAISWETFTHVVHEHPLKWYKRMGFEEIEEWAMITGDIKKVLDKLETMLS